jgi:hypothetical protein
VTEPFRAVLAFKYPPPFRNLNLKLTQSSFRNPWKKEKIINTTVVGRAWLPCYIKDGPRVRLTIKQKKFDLKSKSFVVMHIISTTVCVY